MSTVRQPAVAGLFYPGNPDDLTHAVAGFLQAAHNPNASADAKALIVPHAGYIYSGSTAAAAYAGLATRRNQIKRVVLLGPAHRVHLQGLAATDVAFFRTPLGDIPQDNASIHDLLELPQVNIVDDAHWQEHSLEVQLPFLQKVLGEFTLVPLVVGDATTAAVEQVLERVWDGDQTLIVISSDLSHYHDYATARRIDDTTRATIENLDAAHLDHHQACGYAGIKGLLQLARRRQMAVTTLAICNSGDTAGDRDRVVGYGSWAFTENSNEKSAC